MNQEPTNTEIIEAINEFSNRVDKEFTVVKTDIACLKSDVAYLKSDVACLKSDVACLKSDVAYLKSNIVDKDHLDRALSNQKGDIVFIMRKEDVKLRELIAILNEKKVLTSAEAQHILSMEPFPQLSA